MPLKTAVFLKLLFVFLSMLFSRQAGAQNTQIRGFADVNAGVGSNGLSYSLGEQDLFITSSISDRLSFLGETIFKYSPTSSTKFSASVERIIFNYSLYGNHSLIAGKIHSPINYWNDVYHHGRVFFPTIDRPLLFDSTVIPLHSLGTGFQGRDLGSLKFGYNLFLANGLGSGEILDNNRYKSLTAALWFKPLKNMRIGLSWYHDVISSNSMVHSMRYAMKTTQDLLTFTVANFGKNWEFLLESTSGFDRDSAGTSQTMASYAYLGYRIKDKIIPYGRYDYLQYHGGNHMARKDVDKLVLGLRYQLNYLAVVKLEFQAVRRMGEKADQKVLAQIAVGF